MDPRFQFPDRFKIDSPDIQAIRDTATRISNWLHRDLREIMEPLQVLRELPAMLTSFKERMVEQFDMMFTGQAELQLLSRQANIKVIEQKLDFTGNHIEKKQQQFEDVSKRVVKRYRELAEQLSKEHESFLNRLDSHAYEILDKTYPVQVEERVSLGAIPASNYLVAHTLESAYARTVCLEQGFAGAREAVSGFLEQRRNSYEELKDLSTSALEEGAYELPFWFVETEDIESGAVSREIVFPWDVIDGSEKPGDEIAEDIRALAEKTLGKSNYYPIAGDPLEAFTRRIQRDNRVVDAEAERFKKDCSRIALE
jgi:hypothetical protein